ncbi:MAG: DNA-binding protein [Xanthobacteraceae bacterium]
MRRYAEEDEKFLSSSQVRQRYGDRSDMWIWRRLKDKSGFPQPIDICGRRFWKLSDLVAWERKRASEAA